MDGNKTEYSLSVQVFCGLHSVNISATCVAFNNIKYFSSINICNVLQSIYNNKCKIKPLYLCIVGCLMSSFIPLCVTFN